MLKIGDSCSNKAWHQCTIVYSFGQTSNYNVIQIILWFRCLCYEVGVTLT